MFKILISACLMGQKVRYNGQDVPLFHDELKHWADQNFLIPFCPEIAGGLPVPRAPAEIQVKNDKMHLQSKGTSALEGKAHIIGVNNQDMTEAFLAGAYKALDFAQNNNVKLAILKENSPSCGSNSIYDGTFSGLTIPGEGVTTALLRQHDIPVFSEQQVGEALAYAKTLL